MTKKLFLVSLMFLIIFSSCSSKYNTNPDNSTKIDPDAAVDLGMPIESIDQLVRSAELIIIGTVSGKKDKDSISIEPAAAKMIKNKVPDAKTENIEEVTVDQVKIDEVIYGSYDDKFIKIRQYYQAELKKGEKIVCLLKKDILTGNGDHYIVSDGEHCIFKVNKSKKLMSLTSNMTVAKYDDRPLSLLKEDLKNSIKKVKNKEEKK